MTDEHTAFSDQSSREVAMQRVAADGVYTCAGRPRHCATVSPYLALADPGAAIAWYCNVFGAKLVYQTLVGELVVHAELDFGMGCVQVGAANPAHGTSAPTLGADVSFSLAVYTADVDQVVQTAVEHGATVREPLSYFVSGDLFASIVDPFGVRWSVMTRVDDISPQESAARVDQWAQQFQSS